MPSLRDMVMEMLAGRGHDAGEIDIDIDELAAEAAPSDGVTPREGMFKESSFDLLHGLEVSEEPMDTMPDELIEVFLKH